MKSNERTERIKIEQSNLNASTSHHLNIFSPSQHLTTSTSIPHYPMSGADKPAATREPQ